MHLGGFSYHLWCGIFLWVIFVSHTVFALTQFISVSSLYLCIQVNSVIIHATCVLLWCVAEVPLRCALLMEMLTKAALLCVVYTVGQVCNECHQ